MNHKQALLKKIQIQDFAVQEASLYLISHPKDKSAMEYYQHSRALLKEAIDEYEQNYGPLTSRSNLDREWKYVYGPWPWEGEN